MSLPIHTVRPHHEVDIKLNIQKSDIYLTWQKTTSFCHYYCWVGVGPKYTDNLSLIMLTQLRGGGG